MGAYAATQAYDGIWRFSWAESVGAATNAYGKSVGFFESTGDPVSLESERAAVCLYRRGDLVENTREYLNQINPLLLNKPQEGVVKSINLFYTVLTTLDNKRVNVPNGGLMNATVTDVSAEPIRRVDLTFLTAKSEKPAQIQAWMKEVMAANEKVLSEPAPFAQVSGGTEGPGSRISDGFRQANDNRSLISRGLCGRRGPGSVFRRRSREGCPRCPRRYMRRSLWTCSSGSRCSLRWTTERT